MKKLVVLLGLALFVGCADSGPSNVADGATPSEIEQYRAMVAESEKAEAEAYEAAEAYKGGPDE